MDLDRMLERCRRDQWRADDLDWSGTPRTLSRDDELAIVQLFTDMAGIERLAGALFEEQAKRAKDERLGKIFRTFVADEIRHAEVAERLARYYDVHRYRRYETNRALRHFSKHFVKAVTYLSDDVANTYVTAGELILDIALLRSIDDYVHDDMSRQAMTLINRDESRHIAIDYHMVEHYASKAYADAQRHKPKEPLRRRVEAAATFAAVLYWAAPFFRAVFFQPMELVDPGSRRMREAFKRMQLLGAKEGVNERPFSKFMKVLQDVHNHRLAGPLVGKLAARLSGVEPQFMAQMYTAAEWQRASTMTFDALAEDALQAKLEG